MNTYDVTKSVTNVAIKTGLGLAIVLALLSSVHVAGSGNMGFRVFGYAVYMQYAVDNQVKLNVVNTNKAIKTPTINIEKEYKSI
jgi:hypothetical protein